MDAQEATLIRAEGDSRVREKRAFRPWLLASEELDPTASPITDSASLRAGKWRRLHGRGLAWLVEFAGWNAFLDGLGALRMHGVAHYAYRHPVKQFLVRSGITLFKRLEFDGIRRLQFDLETATLRPDDTDARILLIAVGDNRGQSWCLAGDDEGRILSDFVELVREIDPDALEGHNVFGFDLPYLAARGAVLGVPLALGRNGSLLRLGRERNCSIGGITRPFRPASVWGRHVLDTLLAVQRYDVPRGELESHALKSVAVHYGMAAEERVYLDRTQIGRLWSEDPDRVRRYAAQDVLETRRLASLTLPTEFYQSQMVPDSYQNVATGGSGEKINSLMVREYLRRGHGVPQRQAPAACPGGYTEVRRTGVLRRVVKADVESLYPSIMLRYDIRPAADELGAFLPMLAELTARRLDAKARAKQGGADAAYWDGLQASFKILINSFYGYLGAHLLFNDYAAATRVTTTGQQIVKQVADELERTGSAVIEIDTDGVYFIPPDDVRTEAEEEAYVERIGSGLPHGIRLTHDGRYAAMVSLKMKNYVLAGYDGRRVVRGASLRSRADEPFGREFMARAIDYLLDGDLPGLAVEYRRLYDLILTGTLPPEQFCRRERVTENTFRSVAKRRSREVAEDFQVGDSLVVYQREDGSLGLAANYAGDEDRWHYLDKLHRFAARIQDAIGPDFPAICPRPTRKQVEAEKAGQLTLF